MILSMIYASNATLAMSPETMSQIARDSARRNEQAGITGLLLCGGGTFLQVLEGDAVKVSELYDHIARDLRHKQCKVLYKCMLGRAIFPDWNMGLLNLDEVDARQSQQWEALSQKLSQSMNAQATGGRQSILNCVREFIAVHDSDQAAA